MLALTRSVPSSIARCELTHIVREPIDWDRAVAQHRLYEETLETLGCRVTRLAPLDEAPDSVFVEDTAVVLDECAVVTRPGAPSRRQETQSVEEALRRLRELRCITAPGTLDGGDVLRVGQTLFVGRSTRTNAHGIDQLDRAVRPFGYEVRAVTLGRRLHLKSAASTLGDRVLVEPTSVDRDTFDGLTTIDVDPSEPGAANVLFVNGTVICSANAPRTAERLERAGYRVVAIDASELAKAEAGLTCCSLLVNDAAD